MRRICRVSRNRVTNQKQSAVLVSSFYAKNATNSTFGVLRGIINVQSWSVYISKNLRNNEYIKFFCRYQFSSDHESQAALSTQLKCGYCGWLLNTVCQNLWKHRCFANYDEKENLINVDQNSIVTIVRAVNANNTQSL